jgi:transmembrane sensor
MERKDFNKELIRRYRNNKATAEELEVFFHLMNEGKLEKELEEVMTEESVEEEATGIIVPMYRRTWFRVAAAAILIFIAGGIFLLLNRTTEKPRISSNPPPVQNDVAPGGNKAILTLADNSTITLDNAANGALTQQGETKVLKLNDGQLAYNTDGKPSQVFYNTITTPRGGQYQIVLEDGTKVWLNAASSLHFPTAFVGTERKVEITGEAYFEVAKNPSMPFRINVDSKAEVEVLGTHFNINSYPDETTINTTLLEGKVKVTAAGSGLPTPDPIAIGSRLLSPGQQAQLNSNGQIGLNKNPDIEEVMAWKNGKFQFGESADIATIMRQISRWYDVDVEYRGTIPEHIGGTISRDVTVSKVFEMLEMTGGVKFQVNGKKVIVMPGKK